MVSIRIIIIVERASGKANKMYKSILDSSSSLVSKGEAKAKAISIPKVTQT